MEDHEIYEIASDVLNSIADDLSRGIYAELNGTLNRPGFRGGFTS